MTDENKRSHGGGGRLLQVLFGSLVGCSLLLMLILSGGKSYSV
jgi:hypothetical protein